MTDAKDEKEIEFKIPIDKLYPKFSEHLEIENNSRILFSGKFGIGKTYFLNEFFEDKKDKYEVFHLFPINYQISSNKDIIEYLKYDISVELYQKDEDIYEKNDYLNFIDLQSLLFLYGKENLVEIFKTGVSYIQELGKPLKETIGLVEKFWKFKKKLESNEIIDFVNKIKKKNISESDYLSELLKDKIEETKKDKKSILILDDLDRIDPEHIFRILNVFSAHFDQQNNELFNKFGFDKIIIVADYLNLKSIFHHKYGNDTDFNGYFDKFFSVEVFEFNNEGIIVEFVDRIISNFRVTTNYNLQTVLNSNGLLRLFLIEILLKSAKLPGKEKLNLRQLLKGVTTPIISINSDALSKERFFNKYESLPFVVELGIETLISIYGGVYFDFLTMLKKIKVQLKPETKNYNNFYEIFSEYLLDILTPFNKVEEKSEKVWNDYSIVINRGIIKNVTSNKNKKEINVAFLFYDLLLEYVKGKYYKKTI